MYTVGPKYWNVPVLVNTGIFLLYHYYLKKRYLLSLERASIIQKMTILEHKNSLVVQYLYTLYQYLGLFLFFSFSNYLFNILNLKTVIWLVENGILQVTFVAENTLKLQTG